jgi:hypothetical protein
MREKNPSYYFNIDYYLINVYIRNTNHPALHTIYQSYCIMHTTYCPSYQFSQFPYVGRSQIWRISESRLPM